MAQIKPPPERLVVDAVLALMQGESFAPSVGLLSERLLR